ncbi:MAG: PadR family transcriptional regulator [Phycisphaerae bacterium]|nr:PadR family transcriptional regulator [Phycisphaerae bacterium]
MGTNPDLVRGTLSTILLETVCRGPMYGYQICKAVDAKTDGYFELREGSLYPALHKLERDGLLKSFWEETEAGRRRKYYQITDSGEKALAAKRREWTRFSAAVQRVLGTPPPAGEATPMIAPA